MAKDIPDATLTPSLSKFATATVMHACAGQPANFAALAGSGTGKSLANVAITAGQITIADDTSGRSATVPAKSAVTVTANGTADHVALADATTLIAVTTCAAVSLTTTAPVTFPTWKWNITDPA